MKRILFFATIFMMSTSFCMQPFRACARLSARAKARSLLTAIPHRGFGLCPDEKSQKLIDEIGNLRDQKAIVCKLNRQVNVNGVAAVVGIGLSVLYAGEVSATSLGMLAGSGIFYGSCRFDTWRFKSDIQKEINAKEAELDAIARKTGIVHYQTLKD